MHKKSQVTLPVIMGLVLLFATGTAIYIQQISNKKVSIELSPTLDNNLDKNAMTLYISEKIQNIVTEEFLRFGKSAFLDDSCCNSDFSTYIEDTYGRYYYLDEIGGGNGITTWNYDNYKNKFEETLRTKIISRMGFIYTTSFLGWEMEYGAPTVSVSVAQNTGDNVNVEIEPNVIFKKEDKIIKLESVLIKYKVRIKEMMTIALTMKEITKNIENNFNSVCVGGTISELQINNILGITHPQSFSTLSPTEQKQKIKSYILADYSTEITSRRSAGIFPPQTAVNNWGNFGNWLLFNGNDKYGNNGLYMDVGYIVSDPRTLLHQVSIPPPPSDIRIVIQNTIPSYDGEIRFDYYFATKISPPTCLAPYLP